MRGAVAVLAAVAAVVVAVVVGRGDRAQPHGHTTTGPITSPATTTSDVLPQSPRADPAELAADIERAQEMIDAPSSTAPELADAGRFQQLAILALAGRPPRARRVTLGALRHGAAVAVRADLAASAALSRLAQPRRRLPNWRIVHPPAPATLLRYFMAAQARFGVPWQDLAAIELIETQFGRVHGLSTAGARGPMQFLPSTWARYGRGSIDNPRDAILGAARYLVANGAPRDMPDALYHYNNSTDYVHAVEDYANSLRADRRAYYGYYYWQVIYARRGGPVILPLGFPKVRPVRLRVR